MAYQETTGSSPDDIINKIATFAEANGWTVVQNTLVGSNRTLALQVEDTSDYVWVWNVSNSSIRVAGSIGYEEGTAIGSQSGYSGNYAEANIGVGPYTNVFLFGDEEPSPHVHVVIEMSGGIFRHLSFGMMDKLGEWTGGTYYDASYWSSSGPASTISSYNGYHRGLFDCNGGGVAPSRYGSVRCDIPADSIEDAWAHIRANASHRIVTGINAADGGNNTNGSGYLISQFYSRNNPPFSGQITLGTIRGDVVRAGGFYSPVGTFPNVRFLNMARYSPGQEITVGSDVWKVFPLCRKGTGPDGQPYSSNYAYAYKKVS